MNVNQSLTIEEEEKRFNRWLERLELSYKNYLAEAGQDDSAKAALLSAIQESVKSDSDSYPQWIAAQKASTLGKLASSSTDLKVFLRHVTFPGVLQSYHDLHGELLGAVAAATTTTEGAEEAQAAPAVADIQPLDIVPLSSRNSKSEGAVRAFFEGIAAKKDDGLMGLCKLADIHHRINRANEHDTHQVSTWLETERARSATSQISSDDRQMKLALLRGEDEDKVVEKSFESLRAELDTLGGELAKAEDEEEQARRAYEAAIQRKRKSQDRLTHMESFVDSAEGQRDVLQKINAIRLEVDVYNRDSAAKRVQLFEGMMGYIGSVQAQVLGARLSQEIPQLFSHLVGLFNAASAPPLATQNHAAGSNGTSPSSPLSTSPLFCAARVGLETVRLWRQLNAGHLYPALSSEMDGFEAQLRQLQSGLPAPTASGPESAGVFRSNDSTVVLYFDHLYHDTPEEHVEAQSRVSTCMRMLTTRLAAAYAGSAAAMDVEGAGRCRRLHMLNCNDVLAPPTWCLPLTHSPQYLSHLWRLAEEAHEGDLYIPLEFDTEWESEDPYRSGGSDEEDVVPGTRRHPGHLHKTMALPGRVGEALGQDAAATFASVFTPVDGDQAIARVIRRQEQREAAKISQRRRRDGDYMVPNKAARNRKRRDRLGDRTEGAVQETRVKTPYGEGVLLPAKAPRADDMLEVRLDYGVGYFHSGSVEVLHSSAADAVDEEEEEEDVSASRGKERRSRASEGGGTGSSSADSRFVHTDLRLHRVLQRMVARVKVQRILGDLIGLNHANLSLWMHGRTSVGLNKTTERAISKWLATYDRKALRRLLNETDNDEYSPENANAFLARLGALKVKKGSVPEGGEASNEDSDSSLDGARSGSKKRPYSYAVESGEDSNFESDVERANALRYSEDKVQRKSSTGDLAGMGRSSAGSSSSRQQTASSSASSGAPASDRVVSNLSIGSYNAPAGILEKASTQKFTRDGETLRNLMLSIMRTLKISQGAIANDYYKNYRYETSQGGVSAWFHYRGVLSTFERMNRCAIMWVEDYKAHLSPAEREKFADLCARMSSGSGDSKPAGEASAAADNTDELSEAEPQSSASAEDELMAVEDAEAQEEASGATVAAMETEDSEDTVTETEAQTTAVKEEPPVAATSPQAGAAEVAPAAVPEQTTSVKQELESKRAASEADDDESVSAAGSSSANAAVLSPEEECKYADAKPTTPAVVEVRTIADLHSAVIHEIYRRNLTQSAVVAEANLTKVDMALSALSKFLNIATVTNNQRGSKFCQLMLKWLDVSRAKPTAPRDANGAAIEGAEGSGGRPVMRERVEKPFDPFTCGLCQKKVGEFANHKSFHMHIAWCYRRKRGQEPPAEYKMKNSGGHSGEAISKRKAPGAGESDQESDKGGEGAQAKRQRSESNGDASKRRASADQDLQRSAGGGSGRSNEMASDSVIVEADSFAAGDHYDSCEVCRERTQPGTAALCVSCPCVYHMRCLGGTGAPPSGKWNCPKCVESGANSAQLMPEDLKNSQTVENVWILVYSSSLRRWRKAVVIAKHPSKNGVVLVKWWRSDNRGGKTIWMDISRAAVLVSEGEVKTSAYSRNRMQQLTSTSHRQLGVKFEEQGAGRNAQFKAQRNSTMVHMDGSSSGAVTPGQLAAASGLGGVGALQGDGEQEKQTNVSGNGMSDTYVSSNSLKAALCAAGTACRAVDIAMCNENTNVFACTRPPGHHAGRYGCTAGCLSTGFCLLNNAAIATYYSRVRWGLQRVAVIDIDVHFGNGTAELLGRDPNAFFASVHMIYGHANDGGPTEVPTESEAHHKKKANAGFYPSLMGQTEVTDNYVSVGVYPSDDFGSRSGSTRGGVAAAKKRAAVSSSSGSDGEGAGEGDETEDLQSLDGSAAMTVESGLASEPPTPQKPPTAACGGPAPDGVAVPDAVAVAARRTFKGAEGFLRALSEVIIPQMAKFNPQLLIISAGFDGYVSDPIGGQLCLSLDDYTTATKMLTSAIDDLNVRNGTTSGPAKARVISLLEGGYDTSPFTLGLAKCVDAHVLALQQS